MKTAFCRLIPALMIGALVLQGCASTGSAQDHAQGPTAPETSSVAIPEVDGKPVVNADSKEDFAALATAIRQQMLPGGRWQYVNQKERAAIDGTFDDMARLYDQFSTVANMDKQARAALSADQGIVNPILAKRDGERLICTRIVHVGTHLPVERCKTYAEIQAQRQNTQRDTRQFYRQRNSQPNVQNGGLSSGSH